MEFLNKSDHLDCYRYNNPNIPLILYEKIRKGEIFKYDEIYDQIFFLLRGKINISYENEENNVIEEGTFLLFSDRHKFTINAEEDSSVVVVSMHSKIKFCHHFTLELLNKINEDHMGKDLPFPHPFKANEIIYDYLNSIVKTMSNGLKCTLFHELKQKELLYYLITYYPKKDLAAFFAPLFSHDFQFAKMVHDNYESVKNIEDLAARANYSLSGFKKRFIKVFGISPRHWIENEKAKKIYHEINCTQKTLKEIAIEYEFSSESHFNKFCKRAYQMSPSALREYTKQRVLFND